MAEYGNTSAASIPLALDESVRAGTIKKGDVVRARSRGNKAGVAEDRRILSRR